MLEANPNLGYRDVQLILAYSARQIATESNTWKYNGAKNWNGGGLHYDSLKHNLGFGMVDALAAVRLAETWSGMPLTSSNVVEVAASVVQPASIPDGTSFLSQSVRIERDISVERVELSVDISHSYIGDLGILLTSPSGTSSWILYQVGKSVDSPYGADQDDIDFTFTTVLSIGERSVGSWSLAIFDLELGDVGTLKSWSINLIGRNVSDDDVYFFSDEFSEVLTVDSSRATLVDAGGIDLINASMVTTDVRLDLNPSGVNTIAGAKLTISNQTKIEKAISGDGNDFIAGNAEANELSGMRGNDQIVGGAGNDSITGGIGTNQLTGGAGNDTFNVVAAAIDTITDLTTGDVFAVAPSGTVTAINVAAFVATAATTNSGSATIYAANGGPRTIDLTLAGGTNGYTMIGGDGNDTITGSALADSLSGGTANDTFIGSAGNDRLNGGTGIDTAQFSSTWGNYKTSIANKVLTVVDERSGNDGTDSLTGIERLKFTDKSIAIDLDGNAGNTAKVIGAVLGSSSVKNPTHVGIGLSYTDKGMSYSDLGALALSAVGASTNDAIVTTLWRNVVGFNPSAAEKAPFIKMLADGMKAGDLVVLAADTASNTANIGLVGLIQTGIEYTPV